MTEIAPTTEPSLYIEDLALSWVSDTQVRLEVGEAYIPSTDKILEVTTPITKTVPNTVDGLFYLYLFENAGVPDLEVSTTAPAAPYLGTARTKSGAGATTHRYLGMVRNDGFGNLIPFETESLGGGAMLFTYQYPHNSTALNVANHTGTLTATTFKLGPSAAAAQDRLVSPATRIAMVFYHCTGGAFAKWGWATKVGEYPLYTQSGGQGYAPAVRLSADQEVQIALGTTATNLELALIGYYERR